MVLLEFRLLLHISSYPVNWAFLFGIYFVNAWLNIGLHLSIFFYAILIDFLDHFWSIDLLPEFGKETVGILFSETFVNIFN